MKQRPTAQEIANERLSLLRTQLDFLAYELDACIPFGPIHGHYKKQVRLALNEITGITFYSVARRERRRRNS